jgi:serine/threonine protein kinase
MTPDTADDDRTVIRPVAKPGPAGLGAAADGSAPALPLAGPSDADRTQIKPRSTTAPSGADAAAPADVDMGNGLPVGTLLGEFELTALLGEGGFGIVYLASDHSLQRRVALKEYMPSVLAARAGQNQVQVKSERHRETFEAGRKSFVNEARLLAQFDHPSLVKVYRFWEANGTAYMVMPFYEGKTLKDTLRELGGPPTEAWLRGVLDPLTEALAVIHREQCYHRDIAPDNVMMLAGSQRPLLLDFGAARRVIGDMTQALTVILKPGYAPVEQYAEIPGMKQGAWTDVYALAAVVYFAIMGKTPPPSVGRLLNDSFVPLTQAAAGRYSHGFLAAIDHALAIKPEQRTQSIEQLRAELGLDGSARPLPTPTPTPTGVAPQRAAPGAATTAAAAETAPRKNTALIALAVGVVVLGLAFGAYRALSPAARPSPAGAGQAPASAEVATAKPLPVTAPPGAVTAVSEVTGEASAAAGFDVAAEFERIKQAQTAGFKLQALATKSQLRIGHDELSFTVQSDRDGFLYVQAYSSDGSLMMIYPNATVGSQKVRKNQPLKLPQPPIYFETTEPVGPTLLLVMVSARERDFAALQPRKDGPYRLLPVGLEAQRIAATQAPSRVPLQAGRAICPNASPCEDEFGAAVIRFDTVR